MQSSGKTDADVGDHDWELRLENALALLQDVQYEIELVYGEAPRADTPASLARMMVGSKAMATLSTGYLNALEYSKVRLQGPDLARATEKTAPKVAIISEKMARHFQGNAVGQQIAFGRRQVFEVIAVASDTRYARIKDAPREVVYLPMFQQEPRTIWYAPTFEVRYAGSAEAILRLAREGATESFASSQNSCTLSSKTDCFAKLFEVSALQFFS